MTQLNGAIYVGSFHTRKAYTMSSIILMDGPLTQSRTGVYTCTMVKPRIIDKVQKTQEVRLICIRF